MSYLTGRDGSMTVNGKPVAKVRDWRLTTQVAALDVTTLADDNERVTPGLRSASGSATLLWYKDAPVPILQKIIKRAPVREDDMISLNLRLGDNSFVLKALITSADLGATTGDVASAAINFTADDAYQQVAFG